MSFKTITVAHDERGVATLTLNRPEKHNAMSARMIGELTDAAEELAADANTRVVILAGAGSSFCAGGDLEWMRAQFDADRTVRMNEARKLAMMLKALNELPKPLLARVHGQAFGGGVGLMSVCDSVIAVEGVAFGLTETRLGLIPATISPYVLARMGEGKARRVFMSARIFKAHVAEQLGLVSRVVAEAELETAIDREVAPYLKTAPAAVAQAKALARSLGPQISSDTIEDTIERLADTWETPEAKEGVLAFLEKRSPSWGR